MDDIMKMNTKLEPPPKDGKTVRLYMSGVFTGLMLIGTLSIRWETGAASSTTTENPLKFLSGSSTETAAPENSQHAKLEETYSTQGNHKAPQSAEALMSSKKLKPQRIWPSSRAEVTGP